MTPKPGIQACMIGHLQNAPRAILGMFDVSARSMVEKDVLTLAMPYPVFLKLLENVAGSFLETESWGKVLKRI